MALELSEDEIRAAVKRTLKPGVSAASAQIEAIHRSRCTVLRLNESRQQVRCDDNAPPEDLRGLQLYEGDLMAVPIAPPLDVRDTRTVRLMKRGTLKNTKCTHCHGTARAKCLDCDGTRKVDCPRRVRCADCGGGMNACTACNNGEPGSWQSDDKTSRPPKPTPHKRPRAKCELCRTPNAACALCRGRGDTKCGDCNETGKADCTGCKAGGKVDCPHCERPGRKSTGRKVTWTEGHIVRAAPNPPQNPLELPRTLLRSRVLREISTFRYWSPTPLDGPDAPLPPLLDESHRSELKSFCAPSKPAAGKTGHRPPVELLHEIKLEQLPLYRVTLPALEKREFYVFAGTDGARAVSLATPKQVRKRWAMALTTVLLVLLVLTLVVR
ncbi:hypothetical protein ACH4SP_08930 [Streptomyces sp. NPDC021093]|uniref:hypothetical protein n=1 Tax=Streptomyces sp. NPDC021093 TaxID=3365112 RepID=UPI003792E3C3